MTRVVDLWRAVDPDARLGSGSVDALQQPVRAVLRTRAAPPHLPPPAESHLLVTDPSLLGGGLDAFFRVLDEAGQAPSAVIVAFADADAAAIEPSANPRPVLLSAGAAGDLQDRAARYLADEPAALARLTIEMRLACAEAALADPMPSVPAGLIALRLRRGVAVAHDGRLSSLHARPAGRALAARFAALHARVLAGSASARSSGHRRRVDGVWLLERTVRPGTSVWLFDDLPLAEVDEVGAEALMVTLRALIRRPAPDPTSMPAAAPPAPPAAGGGRFAETLLAVARANGRIAPAARALGVHRNTVRYRLRVARAERGLDPRRPDDALRILREAGRAD